MQRKKDYKARVLLVFLCFLFFYSVIAIRLFLLQIYQKDFFKILARHQHYVTVSLEPERAKITDRRGTLLAFNKEASSAFILPLQLRHKKKTQKLLRNYYPHVYKKMKKSSKRHFLWLERKLTPDRFVFLKNMNNKDIKFIQESQRFYPFKSLSHVIGFTDIDNKGIAGLELEFSKKLQGTAAQAILSKDARSKNLYFDKKIIKHGKSGEPLRLTIDHRLQFLACKHLQEMIDQLQAQSGAVLVMNPDTGEILVMGTCPLFDANAKNPTDLKITKNMVTSECFELGSVMKTFSAMAVLEEKAVEFDELIDCEGKVGYIDGFRVENWKYLEVLPFRDVVRFSSNIGLAKVVKRIGDKLYDHLMNFGFGRKTGILFPGEREGFVNHPSNWSKSSPFVMSFGYEIMATLLQLGTAISVIANGGYFIKPKIIFDRKVRKNKHKLYSDLTLSQIKESLTFIGEKYAPIKGYRTMGKTGTVRMLVDGQYSHTKHLYTFAGIIEQGDYRRVIVSFIKEPANPYLWATQVAIPVFKKVAEKLILYDTLEHQI